jgi:hypothetical protein
VSLLDDVELLDRCLGWSREVRCFEDTLAQRANRNAGELRRAGEAVLRLLPEGNDYSRYRAAITRLLDAERVRGR